MSTAMSDSSSESASSFAFGGRRGIEGGLSGSTKLPDAEASLSGQLLKIT